MPHSTAPSSIPVIDISDPSPEVAQEVLDAASTHGFLFIKNDGVTVPPADIDAMFQLVFAIHLGGDEQELIVPVPHVLRPAARRKGRIHHTLRQSRRHQSRLGIHARRIPRSIRAEGTNLPFYSTKLSISSHTSPTLYHSTPLSTTLKISLLMLPIARRPQRSLQHLPTPPKPPTPAPTSNHVLALNHPLPNLLPHPLPQHPRPPRHRPPYTLLSRRIHILHHAPRPLPRPLRLNLPPTLLSKDQSCHWQ
jgi:hypothetical protein